MDLARRSITSVSWNVLANVATVVLSFVRSIVLARLLLVDTFGIYAGLVVIIEITLPLTDFGLGSAFIHRAPETEDEQEAAAAQFTLKFIFVALWFAILNFVAFRFFDLSQRIPFLVLIWMAAFEQVTQTAPLILVRRVMHKRIAAVTVANVVIPSILSILFAVYGFNIWALVVSDIATPLIAFAGYYLWRPVWRMRFAWRPATVRYFLSFGSRSFLALMLYNLLDRVDDLWTRFRLGATAMGYYSRAYKFAIYPRSLLSAPIISVMTGTYAELKYDKPRLSSAFFRVNALLIRSGFFLAGYLALIAPEFIRIFLTARWMPMLVAFRLMLVFTLFDPLKLAVSGVLAAVGKPEQIVYTRAIQLAVMIAGLALLSTRWGISGVAAAVDVMLCVGIAIFFWQVRMYVDYSLKELFAIPTAALLLGLFITDGIIRLGNTGNDWMNGAIKTLAFFTIYFGFLLLTERRRFTGIISDLKRYYRPEGSA